MSTLSSSDFQQFTQSLEKELPLPTEGSLNPQFTERTLQNLTLRNAQITETQFTDTQNTEPHFVEHQIMEQVLGFAPSTKQVII